MAADGSHAFSPSPYIRMTLVLDSPTERKLALLAEQRETTPNTLIADLINKFVSEQWRSETTSAVAASAR
jgi:predicted transcriptional regulator